MPYRSSIPARSAAVAGEIRPALGHPLVRGGDVDVVLEAAGELGLVAVALDDAGQEAGAAEGGVEGGLGDAGGGGAGAETGDPGVEAGIGDGGEILAAVVRPGRTGRVRETQAESEARPVRR